MAIRAALFDLGNTLVSYYQSSEFPPILRSCLRQALSAAGISVSKVDEPRLFEHAMRLNKEREDLAVRPLADRLQELFSDPMPNSPTPRWWMCVARSWSLFSHVRGPT
jgi:hypothetical protein